MKLTAVELLMESILGKDFRLTCSDEQLNAYQQAKQMESEQTISKMETIRENGIVELSDEEIKQGLFGGQFDDQDDDDLSMLFGAKWYREQLKQK